MRELILGIDLGGACSRTAWFDDTTGRVEITTQNPFVNRMPSVVALIEEKLVVGEEAEEKCISDPDCGVFYHLAKAGLGHGTHDLGGRHIQTVEIAEYILKELKIRAEKRCGGEFTKAVLASPLSFDPGTQEVLRNAAIAAGFSEIQLIPEPLAAVTAAINSGAVVGNTVLVCDLGAMSTTLSVLTRGAAGEYSPLALPRILAGGCHRIDRGTYESLSGIFAIQPDFDNQLFRECTRLRERLTKLESVHFTYHQKTHEIDRNLLLGCASGVLEDAARSATQAIQEASNTGHPVETILLVGGGSKLPFAEDVFSKRLSIKPIVFPDSDNLIALGTVWHGNPHFSSNKVNSSDPYDSPEYRKSFKEIKKKALERKLVFLLAGRWGVGKSSTVNSLLGSNVAPVNHYEQGTFKVTPYSTEFGGAPLLIVDTPGLCDEQELKGNDAKYLSEMRKTVKEIDSLWYVTKLVETRPPGPDELRAIRVLSEAFEQKGEIWKSAVIIFTFSNSRDMVPDDRFQEQLRRKTKQFRDAIAEYAGQAIASRIPVIPVDNSTHTVRDSKIKWRDMLYAEVCLTINAAGLVTWMFATEQLLKKKPNKQNGEGVMQDSDPITVPKEKVEPIRSRVEVEVRGLFEILGDKIGEEFGSRAVSQVLGGVGRAVDGFLSWLGF